MPLMECPDCGGVVSDQALTCPTCHRVMGTIDTNGVRYARRYVGKAVIGLLFLVTAFVILRALGIVP